MEPNQIKELSKIIFPKLKEIREHLHKHPELSFQEFETARYISSILTEWGITHKTGIVKTGIVGVIEGKNPETRVIALRGDIDALPIQENSNKPYCSVNNGVMHACGHDVHTTCVLGAAWILNQTRSEWEGTVKLIFQPGEEVLPGGASLMIKEGVLESPKVNKAIAQHVFPSMETGKVGFRSGMYMASTDEIYLTITGKGGHAAMPQDYNNPLLAASAVLLKLQEAFMVKDNLPPEGKEIPTVLAFGKISGAGATNVIPDCVKLEGTFRTMNENWRRNAHTRIADIIYRICSDYQVQADLNIEIGYPYLVNHPEFTEECRMLAKKYLGESNVEELPLRMTAEDFAFFSQQVDSCFYRLGTGNQSKNITSGVHTATFDIDENALEIGAGLMAFLVAGK